jgi:hypothetical protein
MDWIKLRLSVRANSRLELAIEETSEERYDGKPPGSKAALQRRVWKLPGVCATVIQSGKWKTVLKIGGVKIWGALMRGGDAIKLNRR